MVDYFKDFPINLLLIGLFVICIIGFAGSIGLNYGKSSTDMTSNLINTQKIQDQVNKTGEDAKHWESLFKNSNMFVSFGSIITFAIWGVGSLIWTTVTTFFTIYFDMISQVLGIPAMVTGTLTAIILISIIYLVYRLNKLGY